MGLHEPQTGASDEWYTPPELLHAIGLSYDLDPASPGNYHWVPAAKVYTKRDDGLHKVWYGRVFLNPPFGGRNEHVPWLEKFLVHGDGIAIFRAYTSAAWFHDHAIRADGILFPRGKTKFVKPNGSIGKSPGSGVVLLAMGDTCCAALAASGLGFYVDNRAVAASMFDDEGGAGVFD